MRCAMCPNEASICKATITESAGITAVVTEWTYFCVKCSSSLN